MIRPETGSLLRLQSIAAAILMCCCQPLFAQYATPPALDAELQSAQPGDIVNMHGADGYIYLNSSSNRLNLVPGYLVYSDDPETALEHGILYQGNVPAGPARLYAYHVNGLATPAKITAILENTGNSDAIIQFTRKSLRPPSGNYIDIGKNAVKDFFENQNLPADIRISPGGTALVDAAMDNINVSTNQLLSAKYDFITNQPLKASTLMLPAGTNTLTAYETATLATNDGHDRQGTFYYYGKTNVTPYSYSTADNSRLIKIGDGTSYDLDISGIDEERDSPTALRGSFGIHYTLNFMVSSPDGKGIAVLLNPRGGSHAGYVQSTFPVGSEPEGHLVPGSTLRLNDSTKALVCAMIQPTATPQLFTMEYMPPGASSLPVNLLLVPFTSASSVGEWQLY